VVTVTMRERCRSDPQMGAASWLLLAVITAPARPRLSLCGLGDGVDQRCDGRVAAQFT
jgi:hypothetical protein